MNLKPYPKYKDSGIEWLGEVPEGWEVKKLKYVAHVEMGQSPESDFYNKDGNGVPFLQGNADFKEIYPQPQVWTIEGNKYSKKDDILISVRAPVGEINISDNRYAIGRGLVALRFCEKFNFKFYYYLFNKAKNYFDSVSTGTTYTSVSTDDIKNISVVVPPKEHQITIATFLDQKTAKIDKLIKKNETLVELLKEKRQASISHAVTKGIPPHPNPLPRGERGLLHCPAPLMGGGEGEGVKRDLKMKDSGIEWIGEIPEGWEVKKLKYVSVVNPEALGESTPLDFEIKYVDISNVNEEGLINNPELMSFSDAPSRARRIIKKGDVIVSTVRTYLKAIAYFSNPESNMIVSTGFAVLRATKTMLPKFLYYFVRANFFVDSIMANSVGVSYPAINSSVLSGLTVLLPDKNEQTAIADYLDKETKNIDKTIQKIQTQIATLKEYRQALISNVVTGKVRVYDCNLQGKRIK